MNSQLVHIRPDVSFPPPLLFEDLCYHLVVISWALATICLAIATDASERLFVGIVVIAVVTLVLWTMAVYELKIEYVFSKDYNLEGYVVGMDRTIINLSAAMFLLLISPETVDGNNVKLIMS